MRVARQAGGSAAATPTASTATAMVTRLHALNRVSEALLPGSFGAVAESGDPHPWIELLFLSITTLSGVGLSDILPVLPMARGSS
jgi:hypothetical protein